MIQNAPRWSFIFALIFSLAAAVAALCFDQLRRQAPPPPANFLAADKGYGVTLDLTQDDNLTLTATLAELRRSGLLWLRQPISWAQIEPAPGQFDWSGVDRLVEAVTRANQALAAAGSAGKFELIVVLQETPAWARPAGTSSSHPPADFRVFGNFARTFAARYQDQVDFYQIWHQPNLSAGWGDTFVEAAAYADLLREASLNIKATDSEAYLLTAALAATLEAGPLNLSELEYLDRLYQAGADRWFDIVAIQPYGLWTEPLDPPAPEILNFRRAELVREVMRRHRDEETPVWATAFGWVALPADWAGRPSPWSNDLPEIQAPRTAQAIAYARRNWPWLGPLLAARWEARDLAADDPERGLALLETPAILAAIRAVATAPPLAEPGRYPADHSSAVYSPGWRFAGGLADIPAQPPRRLMIPFDGTRLDLAVNRGDFRGQLWVTIDGRPANALPQDDQGRSYLILSDPLNQPDTVTLARHLSPGHHEAVIEADGGWGQWAIAGWTVYHEPDARLWQTGLTLAGLVTVFSGLTVLLLFLTAYSSSPIPTASLPRRLWAWSEIIMVFFNMLGERVHLVLVIGLAIAIYLIQGVAALLLLPVLATLILLRPDLGLLLVTLSLFLFKLPLRLPLGAFSPVEISLSLTLLGLVFRAFLSFGRKRYFTPPEQLAMSHEQLANPTFQSSNPLEQLLMRNEQLTNPPFQPSNPPFFRPSTLPTSTDLAALLLVLLALLSTFAAENFAVSWREWRVVVLESVIFYALVRLGLDFGPPGETSAPRRWAWRLVDTFVAGASLSALAALYFYFLTDQTIDAEGVRRALGPAGGSPNNLALILGRAWPVLLAVAIWDKPARRWLYGLALLPVDLALYLTFSKGALLLGLPAGLGMMGGLYLWFGRRHAWQRLLLIAAGSLALFILALIPVSQTDRFRTAFSLREGSTGFFRLKLWESAWAMLQDHWLLGVGLDNFLYQYRTRYIRPEAWQEPDLNHPHNLILDFGTRLGVGGLILLLWLQLGFWRSVWRLLTVRFDPLILGLAGSMAVTLGHGLVDNATFLVDLAFAFFLTLGLVQRLAEQQR